MRRTACRVSISKAHCTKASFNAAQCLSVIALYASYRSWQEQTEKPLRYDLMQEYEAPKKVESGLVHGQI